MTGGDRTVQVPVSLIEEVLADMGSASEAKLRALLSQPTPTAEACSICEGTGKWTEIVRDGVIPRAVLRDCPVHGTPAEPPRPEDMAPGTTFQVGGESYKIAPSGRILYAGWRLTPWSQQNHQFDPSTVRDVTPPAVTS